MAEQTEEVTTVRDAPARVIKTTRKIVQPPIQTEAPQERYETKKAIFRTYQIIWYVTGFIETLLIFRISLKALGANPLSAFTDIIYTLSYPFAFPFLGMFRSITEGESVFELSTFFGIFVYLLLAYGVTMLFQLVKPTTPEEVEQSV